MGCTFAKAAEAPRSLPELSRTGPAPTLMTEPQLFKPEAGLQNDKVIMKSAVAEHVEFSDEELAFLRKEVLTCLEGACKQGSITRRAYTKLDIENISHHGRTKPFKIEGYSQALTEGRFGIACKKGTKPELPNQDSWTVLEGGEEFVLFVVADGNGNDGHAFSNQACDLLPKYLFQSGKFKDNFQSFKSCVTEAFVKTNEMLGKLSCRDGLDIEHSGTTATLVMYNRRNKCLWLAYVGDCGVISMNNAGTARLLTEDHRPEVEEEARRIQEAGGVITWDGYAHYRIYAKDNWQPGSIVSRMLGNSYGQRTCGMTCQPTVKQIQLSNQDRIVTVATDGVWTFVKPQEVVSLCPLGGCLQQAANDLAELSWTSWVEKDEHSCVDDITAIMFKPNDQP